MIWNWEQEDWPDFRYDAAALAALESKFLHQSGVFFGAYKHITEEEKETLIVDLIADEALKTSEIEGEYLNRDSLQSSIRRQFGLDADTRTVSPKEQGVSEMMADCYKHFAAPLTGEALFAWHKMLMSGRGDLADSGRYRTHEDPMQVVSGPAHAPKIHFEAPPSARVEQEMAQFIKWFGGTAPESAAPLPALTRAGIAHLYFESIHPFEDGNGRIGRAISEKALSENIGRPTLIALSQTIHGNRKAYYGMLERSNKANEITDWLIYFAETILEAQAFTEKTVEFLIEKTKLFDRLRGRLNERQVKAMTRMFREGPAGFEGGLSAENYIAVTGTSRATATRDLQDLVEKAALTRTGARKSTRYWLNVAGKEGL